MMNVFGQALNFKKKIKLTQEETRGHLGDQIIKLCDIEQFDNPLLCFD